MGVLATHTVYGLVASAANPQATARLYALKQREQKPGTVIATNVEQLIALGVEGRFLRVAQKWWPNAVSVIVPTGENLRYLHVGLDSLPMRIPKDKTFCDFLLQTGPLISSSANHPGKPPATTVQEARAYFGDAVDFYLDGGDLSDRQSSTIVRLAPNGEVEVLRQGAVKVDK